jgi:hypothetical protein
MGITIHYSGKAKSFDALSELLNVAQMFAAQREWQFALYDDPFGVMEDRDKDDPGYIECDGPFRGMVIRPNKKCEAVRLDFRPSNEMTPAFTKTQFAPFSVHVEVVKLLKAIAPFMEDFEVMDEAGLWETGDEAAARQKFESLGAAINGLADDLRGEGLEVEGPGVPDEEWGGVPDDEPYG